MIDSSSRPTKFGPLKQFQRFGDAGPVYEVLSVDEARGMARIHVFDTGEELDYRTDRALEDPEA